MSRIVTADDCEHDPLADLLESILLSAPSCFDRLASAYRTGHGASQQLVQSRMVVVYTDRRREGDLLCWRGAGVVPEPLRCLTRYPLWVDIQQVSHAFAQRCSDAPG